MTGSTPAMHLSDITRCATEECQKTTCGNKSNCKGQTCIGLFSGRSKRFDCMIKLITKEKIFLFKIISYMSLPQSNNWIKNGFE